MIILTCLYYFYFLLIFYPKSIWTYQCLKCTTAVFNHLVTTDSLLFPTFEDCNVISTTQSCYVQIDWLADGTTEIRYDINPALPYDTIMTVVERQVSIDTGDYSTIYSIGYSCRSKPTACNTVSNLKRIIDAVTLPKEEEQVQLDSIIFPIKRFNASSCSRESNMINCSKMNPTDCQQCMTTVQYTKKKYICSTCSTGKVTKNFFNYQSLIFLNKISRRNRVTIACQKPNACNSMKNIEKIKKTLTIHIDLEKFYRSKTSVTKTNLKVLFLIILFRIIK